jgi:hypothetical protein
MRTVTNRSGEILNPSQLVLVADAELYHWLRKVEYPNIPPHALNPLNHLNVSLVNILVPTIRITFLNTGILNILCGSFSTTVLLLVPRRILSADGNLAPWRSMSYATFISICPYDSAAKEAFVRSIGIDLFSPCLDPSNENRN